jgi:regulator of extracellular matrix RemA (YlzA/DUF370 family)
MDSDHVILSALHPETLANRAGGLPDDKVAEGELTHES